MIAMQSYDPLHYGVLSSDDIFYLYYYSKKRYQMQHINVAILQKYLLKF